MRAHQRLLRDPWLIGCAVAGALLLGVSTIAAAPWPLWVACGYVALLSAYELLADPSSGDRAAPPAHEPP